MEHGSIHLSARAVAERYFFGKFLPKVPPKSESGRVGRTKTVPDFRALIKKVSIAPRYTLCKLGKL